MVIGRAYMDTYGNKFIRSTKILVFNIDQNTIYVKTRYFFRIFYKTV